MTEKQQRLWARVVRRDGGVCVVCGRAANEVHHIISRRFVGAWRVKNMVSLCSVCHSQAHNRKARVWLLKRLQVLYGYDYSDAMFEVYI